MPKNDLRQKTKNKKRKLKLDSWAYGHAEESFAKKRNDTRFTQSGVEGVETMTMILMVMMMMMQLVLSYMFH